MMNSYGNLSSLFYDAVNGYASEIEVSFYTSFIEKNQGRVLEAMSGSGRLQVPLLARGYVVDGVDASANMLARCRTRLKSAGLSAELYEQKLQELSITHRYATVIIALASFQLITERSVASLCLKNIRAHMIEGATLLIDFFTPISVSASPVMKSLAVNTTTIIRATTRYQFDEQNKMAKAFSLYELCVDDIVQKREEELVTVTWYSDAELVCLLDAAGFELVKIHNVCGIDNAHILEARAIALSH